MAISYKKLWKLLIDKDLMKKDLCRISSISTANVTKMGKGSYVSTELLELTDRLAQTADIDKAESSKILAQYIVDIIEKGFDNVRDNGGDTSAQIDLANKIVNTIINETKKADFDTLKIHERAEQLFALFDKKNSVLALNKKTSIVRPETSIAKAVSLLAPSTSRRCSPN